MTKTDDFKLKRSLSFVHQNSKNSLPELQNGLIAEGELKPFKNNYRWNFLGSTKKDI